MFWIVYFEALYLSQRDIPASIFEMMIILYIAIINNIMGNQKNPSI